MTENVAPIMISPAIQAALWISPLGEAAGFVDRHIRQVIAHPQVFGLTREEILEVYSLHGEPLGLEGRARDDILTHLLVLGWIRVRRHPNAYWTVDTDDLSTQQRSLLAQLAARLLDRGCCGFREADPYQPMALCTRKRVEIHPIRDVAERRIGDTRTSHLLREVDDVGSMRPAAGGV